MTAGGWVYRVLSRSVAGLPLTCKRADGQDFGVAVTGHIDGLGHLD